MDLGLRDAKRLNGGKFWVGVSYVVVPVIGTVICAYLLSQLDSNAITLGVSGLVLGVVVLALIMRGFKAAPL